MVWVLIVLTLIWFIFFLLSIPSIDEYCESQGECWVGLRLMCGHPPETITAWFGINIWESVNCTRYLETKYHPIELKHNITIQQIENKTNLTGGACGLYSPDHNKIIVLMNRTGCGTINNTIIHELKHHICYNQGYLWRNNTDAHEGCFLNVTL